MLRLNVENVSSLASGDPVEVSLAEHGLVIGRAAHADWTLPDASNHVSSIHCEIDYRDGRYILTDKSTNGTFINGAPDRLAKPVQLRDGDLLQIGHYQIRVEEVPEGGAQAPGFGGAAAGAGAFGGIDWHQGSGSAAKPIASDRFGREAPRPLFQSAHDPLMAAFAPPTAQAGGSGSGDPFGLGAPAAASQAAAPDPFGVAPASSPASPAPAQPTAPDPFGIAPPPPRAAPPPAADPFGMAGAAHDPFGTAAPAPPPPAPPGRAPAAADPFGTADPFGAAAAPPPPPQPAGTDPWALLGGANTIDFTARAPAPMPTPAPAPAAVPTPAAAPPSAAAPAPIAAAAPPPDGDGIYARLLAAIGLDRRDLGARNPDAVADTIGQLLRQTADGLFRLLEARTRVRHQFGVGAQVTVFQREGNNPLKWTRSPEEALKQMLGEPARGFLDGSQAVRGAFEDLQAHEMAMIAAMQEAMQETIRRFAPDTIRARISARGWLKSILPGNREATLWRAYETEFSALANESEQAYLDLFARQFKTAYERIVTADTR